MSTCLTGAALHDGELEDFLRKWLLATSNFLLSATPHACSTVANFNHIVLRPSSLATTRRRSRRRLTPVSTTISLFCNLLTVRSRHSQYHHLHLQQGRSHACQSPPRPASKEQPRHFRSLPSESRHSRYLQTLIILSRFLILSSPTSNSEFRLTARSPLKRPCSQHPATWFKLSTTSRPTSPASTSCERWLVAHKMGSKRLTLHDWRASTRTWWL